LEIPDQARQSGSQPKSPRARVKAFRTQFIMAGTLLGFGIFALVAAIVGGGLKAFGFELGAITSIVRQLILAFIGILMILIAEWTDYIKPLFFPLRFISQEIGPITLSPGENRNFSLELKHTGQVDVIIRSIVPHLTEHQTQNNLPELYIRLCSAERVPCGGQQIGLYGSIRRNLESGPATISVFNFASSPPVTFEITTNYPE
jgi:hypothetical protein